MEIERKYLIKELPKNLEGYKHHLIEQGYLSSHPTLRIRRRDDEYILTYKANKQQEFDTTALVNDEVERPLTKEAYEHLLTKIDNNVVRKTRYLIPLEDSLTAELDIFEGQLEGLMFVEVEFKDVEQAAAFLKPYWFGEDVSGDKRYRNTYLSTLSSFNALGR